MLILIVAFLLLGMLHSYSRGLRCGHAQWIFVRGIYGDEINHSGGKRSIWRCAGCHHVHSRDELLEKPGTHAPYFFVGLADAEDEERAAAAEERRVEAEKNKLELRQRSLSRQSLMHAQRDYEDFMLRQMVSDTVRVRYR